MCVLRKYYLVFFVVFLVEHANVSRETLSVYRGTGSFIKKIYLVSHLNFFFVCHGFLSCSVGVGCGRSGLVGVCRGWSGLRPPRPGPPALIPARSRPAPCRGGRAALRPWAGAALLILQ